MRGKIRRGFKALRITLSFSGMFVHLLLEILSDIERRINLKRSFGFYTVVFFFR